MQPGQSPAPWAAELSGGGSNAAASTAAGARQGQTPAPGFTPWDGAAGGNAAAVAGPCAASEGTPAAAQEGPASAAAAEQRQARPQQQQQPPTLEQQQRLLQQRQRQQAAASGEHRLAVADQLRRLMKGQQAEQEEVEEGGEAFAGLAEEPPPGAPAEQLFAGVERLVAETGGAGAEAHQQEQQQREQRELVAALAGSGRVRREQWQTQQAARAAAGAVPPVKEGGAEASSTGGQAQAGAGAVPGEEDEYEEVEDEEGEAAGTSDSATPTYDPHPEAEAPPPPPSAAAQERELAQAEDLLFHGGEDRRDVPVGIAKLEGMWARMEALLAPPRSRRAAWTVRARAVCCVLCALPCSSCAVPRSTESFLCILPFGFALPCSALALCALLASMDMRLCSTATAQAVDCRQAGSAHRQSAQARSPAPAGSARLLQAGHAQPGGARGDLVETTVDAQKHAELAPYSEGTFTLAALLGAGIAGRLLPQDDARAAYMLHRAALVGDGCTCLSALL